MLGHLQKALTHTCSKVFPWRKLGVVCWLHSSGTCFDTWNLLCGIFQDATNHGSDLAPLFWKQEGSGVFLPPMCFWTKKTVVLHDSAGTLENASIFRIPVNPCTLCIPQTLSWWEGQELSYGFRAHKLEDLSIGESCCSLQVAFCIDLGLHVSDMTPSLETYTEVNYAYLLEGKIFQECHSPHAHIS